MSTQIPLTILVTGSNGFIGRNIREMAQNYSWATFVWDSREKYNLEDLNSTLQLFADTKPDVVIHLAARVGGLYRNMEEKAQMFESNLLINLNIIRAAHQHDINRMVCVLSTCIFPDDIDYPLTEEKLHQGPPHKSNEGYAYAKRMMECHMRYYNEQYQRNYVCATPVNLYGPHDNYELWKAHVIPALITKIKTAKETNEPLVIWGSGMAQRQFLFAQDFAKILILLLNEQFTADHYIIAPKEEVTINSMLGTLITVMDFNGQVVFDRSKSDGQLVKTSSGERFQRDMMKYYGHQFKFTTLDNGLKRSV